jgi:lysophospholipase L1-like esterase
VLLVGWSAVAQNGCRVLIEQGPGNWGQVTAGPTFSTPAADSTTYRGLVTMGAAGRYKIRLEFSRKGSFAGLAVAPTDTVSATARPQKRYLIVTDSYGGTTTESGTYFNDGGTFANLLRYLTGHDYIVSSTGGSGYTIAGSGVKFSAHLAATIALCPPLDGVIMAGGYNDATNSVPGATVAVEAALCRSIITAAGITEIIWLSPWTAKAQTTTSLAYFLGIRNQIKALAAANGDRFLDLLSLLQAPEVAAAWTDVTTSAITGGASTTVTVGSAPEPFASGGTNAGRTGWYVTVIDGDNTETRLVTTMNNSNPRTLTTSAWTFSHAAGCQLVVGGPAWITGTGKQGTPTGSGNADRYVGSDGVHPTAAGHPALATTVASLWARSIGV